MVNPEKVQPEDSKRLWIWKRQNWGLNPFWGQCELHPKVWHRSSAKRKSIRFNTWNMKEAHKILLFGILHLWSPGRSAYWQVFVFAWRGFPPVQSLQRAHHQHPLAGQLRLQNMPLWPQSLVLSVSQWFPRWWLGVDSQQTILGEWKCWSKSQSSSLREQRLWSMIN